MKVYATSVWLPILYFTYMQKAVCPLNVFYNHLMWFCTTFQLTTLKCLQKLPLFSFGEEKNVPYSVSHLKTEKEIRIRKELQSLSPKQQATSPASVCNGSTSAVLNCSSWKENSTITTFTFTTVAFFVWIFFWLRIPCSFAVPGIWANSPLIQKKLQIPVVEKK